VPVTVCIITFLYEEEKVLFPSLIHFIMVLLAHEELVKSAKGLCTLPFRHASLRVFALNEGTLALSEGLLTCKLGLVVVPALECTVDGVAHIG